MREGAASFPLVLRRRHIGLAFGAAPSARRGVGSDVAGSRPYRAGDAMRAIDWASSARLSAARDEDAFVVRERFADESPRVVVLSDRRPAMALCPPGLPWLSKASAIRVASVLIAASAMNHRGAVGSLDHGDGAEHPAWLAPTTSGLWRFEERCESAGFQAPADAVEQGLTHLCSLRSSLPAGSFVFVLSDFLCQTSAEAWLRAVDRRWDVVPVVIQDPVWEASFPDVGGVLVPFVDAGSGRVQRVRMGRREARRLRAAHEHRYASLIDALTAFGTDPVLVSSADPDEILTAFLAWAGARVTERRGAA